jgi:hypothetical protein
MEQVRRQEITEPRKKIRRLAHGVEGPLPAQRTGCPECREQVAKSAFTPPIGGGDEADFW